MFKITGAIHRMNTQTLEENAKVDWMNVVKRHKKNQKGLALSTLNTDAGDVETSINMFNMMQPSSSSTVNAMNGGSEGLAEGLKQDGSNVILEYSDLAYDNGLDVSYIHYDYVVDSVTIKEFLQDDTDVRADLNYDNLTDEEFMQKIDIEFDQLLKKYEEKILEHFYDTAVEDAMQDYEPDPTDGLYLEHVDNASLDDGFDMSLRTLL